MTCSGRKRTARARPRGCPLAASVLTPELKAKLESVATATLSSQMRKRG